MRTHPAIFLDRDGVIIQNRPDYVRSWADVEIFPQAITALQQIQPLPHKLIIVTNQAGVAHGALPLPVAEAINQLLVKEIEFQGGRVDGVYLCPHAPADQCACRKPLPGMLLQAAAEHKIDLARSILIGDALTDLEAAWAAGVPVAALVRTGRGCQQEQLSKTAGLPPFPVFDDLSTAVSSLLRL